MAFYGSADYWNKRYKETVKLSPFEWYRGYGHLRHLLNPIYFAASGTKIKNASERNTPQKTVPPPFPASPQPSIEPYTFPTRDKARVLILGCGNSSFGADMLRDGWTGTIANVDFSSAVIDQMKQKYSQHFYQHLSTKVAKPMEFVCADITQHLDYEDGSFDLIVCKGVLDAILCSSKGDALHAVEQCHRLLAPGHGIFFLVTNGNPDSRLEYLEYENSLIHYWRGVSVHTVPKQYQDEKPVYCYICRKRRSEPVSPPAGKENETSAAAAVVGTPSATGVSAATTTTN